MRVGYIGLGNMGKPMASHLAPAGFETTVFDLAQDRVEALQNDLDLFLPPSQPRHARTPSRSFWRASPRP